MTISLRLSEEDSMLIKKMRRCITFQFQNLHDSLSLIVLKRSMI